MKVSLNQLVQMTADLVKQPFNVPLQRELKLIFNYKRADWVQKIVDKHPEQRKYFLKEFTVPLKEVTEEDDCYVDLHDCPLKRTEFQIPQPVRTAYGLFDYVGSPDKMDSFTYTTTEQLQFMNKYGSKYTYDRPKYFYVNGYLYVYNEPNMENLGVRGIWPDPTVLQDFKCANKPCYTDDDQWDIPGDIVNTMVQDVIKNELRLLLANMEMDEVTVDNQN